ncbi:MAG TPA: hypothetical protein PLF40_07465 [Kofleriaceae bacterium]|nr:hypothetical protein [Kofleriaceae bacterium]
MAPPATVTPTAPAAPRAFVLDDGGPHGTEMFAVEELTADNASVRCAFLFDIGEELRLRIERNGDRFEARARVIRVLEYRPQFLIELELFSVGEPTRIVAG